ncbi:hypothetical protein C2I18_03440 [Paenibacillus sp. PK3_47]|uniref:hypothetical protein n=1 Tax=Paenibacillus sp. PK3_47 TaxID=2072642 RepID=UPI00201E452F|nr:hypothetical protein [Paenibacillus sp. PK3_47]UQZ32694.1 hypothetical protein C2I18_03440 [Paenibacillus sp. PK3_47]
MMKMQRTKIYYFGTHPSMLDPVSLKELSFGVIWYEEDRQRYIISYGFGPDQLRTLAQFCASSAYCRCSNTRVMHEIYRSIRDKQQEQDWSARRRLGWLAAFKDPWTNLQSGWYVIRSRSTFPFHLSVIRKTRYSVWLEHAAVCENESELLDCLDRTRATHHLKSIAPLVVEGGGFHG